MQGEGRLGGFGLACGGCSMVSGRLGLGHFDLGRLRAGLRGRRGVQGFFDALPHLDIALLVQAALQQIASGSGSGVVLALEDAGEIGNRTEAVAPVPLRRRSV